MGLVHSLLFICRVLAPRLLAAEEAEEVTERPTPIHVAMLDLVEDEDLLYVVSNYIGSVRARWSERQQPEWLRKGEAYLAEHPELGNVAHAAGYLHIGTQPGLDRAGAAQSALDGNPAFILAGRRGLFAPTIR